MNDVRVLDELNTITTCQKAISELLGAARDRDISIGKLAVLLNYLQERQEVILDKLTK